MKIHYTDADGKSIEIEVSDDVGAFYLESIEAEKKNDRKNSRPDRHTSLESFTHEDARYFSAGVDIPADLFDSEFIQQAMAQLTERQQYLVRKCCLEGFSYTQIAAVEGKHESAIRHAVNRAKKKLEKFLSRPSE